MSFMRAALGLLLPTAVVATVWHFRLPVISVIPDWGLRYGPYLVIAFGMALALGFNKSRALFILIILALAFWVLTTYAPQPPHNTLVYALCSILIPINVLFFYLTRERGVLTSHGLARFCFIIGQAGAAYWLSHHPSFELFAWLTQQFLALPGWLHLQLPQAGAAASIVAIILITINYIIARAGLDEAFLGAVVALFFGFNWIGSAAVLPLFIAMAGALLLFGMIQESYRMAYRDELTGLPSRRAFNDAMASLGRRYAIAMLDVDHFKKFNDTHGQDIGDQVLRLVAAKLRKTTGGGKPFRYGGEEFALIFSRAGVNDAAPHLEALRRNIADYRMSVRGKNQPAKKRRKKRRATKDKHVSVTVSTGLAERDDRLRSPEAVLKAAADALSKAKRARRN